jgi:membrane associated rhomboid family serine protease
LSRQPIFNVPPVIVAAIATLLAIHGAREYALSEEQDGWLLAHAAFVPGRFTYWYDPGAVADYFGTLVGPRGQALEDIGRFFLGDGKPQWWTALTYAGLHADWVHVGVNCLWLAAFGTPVARRFGPMRSLVLFAATAVAGAAAHYVLHRAELNPIVGASASVSGAMAAACRFIFRPNAPLGDGFGFGSGEAAAYRQPALPISRVLLDARVAPFIGLWFVMNFLFGVSAMPLGITENPIAWEAHVGGFVAGLLLFRLLDRSSSEIKARFER